MTSPRITAPGTSPRLRLNVTYGSWELIWSHVHRVLVINLGVVATNLPLLAALQHYHQPWHHPLLFGLLLLPVGPSVAAVFAYLDQTGEDGQASVRVFAQAYARLFRRALKIWASALLAVIAAVADAVTLSTTPAGPALVPMAVVIAVLAALSGILALAHPAAIQGAGFKAFILAPYAVVRHWLLGLMSLGLTAVGLLLINQAPLLGLAVLPGCVLFVVWRNCHSISLLERKRLAQGPVRGGDGVAVAQGPHVAGEGATGPGQAAHR
ncbi:hypothetical protein [Streptomyces chartreusis]|uniref:hypothetical protein n=1 Tax=Streptomyces chartreusis TaxID=1969 RepID=UPI0033B1C40C